MDVINAVYNRRSVKQFDPDYIISAEDERKLLEATIQSPSSFNIQHWRLIIPREPGLRAKLAKAGYGQSQFTDASMLVIFTADMRAWQKSPERYWINAPADVRSLQVQRMQDTHAGNEALQRDEAQRSIGIAMQTLMLVAQSMEYETCAMMGYDPDKVASLIQLPDDFVLGPIVALGKALQQPFPRPAQLSLDEVAYDNSF